MTNGTYRFALMGELDHHGAHNILRAVSAAIEQNTPHYLILDFGGVSFLDSSAIAVIVNAYRQMTQIGGNLRVEKMSDQGRRVIHAAGLDRLIKFQTEEKI